MRVRSEVQLLRGPWCQIHLDHCTCHGILFSSKWPDWNFAHASFHILFCSGIKIPEICVAQVRDELDRMDKEVKRRQHENELKAQEQRLAEQHQRMLEERHREISILYSTSPQLSSLTNMPSLYTDNLFNSFSSLHSQRETTDSILDLTVSGSSRLSPHSTGADVHSAPVADFSINTFMPAEQQQQHQQHQQQQIQSELFNFLNSLPEPSQCHAALPSSTADSLHNAIPASTSHFSSSTIHPSSSSSSLFSPSLTPSSSSSSLSLFSSLSPSDQHPFANCGDDTAIDAKEVLSSMLRSSSDSRQSVIHFRVPESENLS